MSGSFDPYHKWLGISPRDQPPNHYRLLAVDLFEPDPDVISSAADQRMAHVRAFQTGKHSALSQQILNEIAAARVCLLNAEKRAEYDQQLREQLDRERAGAGAPDEAIEGRTEPPVLPPLPPAAPPLDGSTGPPFEETLPRPWLRRRRWAWQALVGILVAAILLLAALTVLVRQGNLRGGAVVGPPQSPIIEPGPSPLLPPETGGSTGTQNENRPDAQAEPPDALQGGPSKPSPPPEPTDPSEPPDTPPQEPPETEPPKQSPIQAIGGVEPMTANPPPETAPQKAPVPAAAAQADAEERLAGVVAAASAADLLTAARAQERTPDERFVLLKKARDTAVGDGDVDTALAATGEIIGRYEIDALAEKVETFNALRDSVTDRSAFRALAEQGIALFDELLAEGRKDVAKQIAIDSLTVARKSGDNDLPAKATIRWLNLESLP